MKISRWTPGPRSPLARVRALPLWLAAASLLVAGCVTAELGPEVTVTGETDLLEMLPAEASLAVSVDVEGMREAELGSTLLEDPMVTRDEEWEELRATFESFGIDLERDVRRVVVATDPGAGELPDKVAIAVDVAYDESRLMEALAGRPALDYEGHTLYEIDTSELEHRLDSEDEDEADHEAGEGSEDQAEGGEEGSEGQDEDDAGDDLHLVVVGAETLLLGNEGGLRAALDTVDGRAGSLRDAAEMSELIDDAAPDSHIWMVAARRAFEDRLEGLPSSGVPVSGEAVDGLRAGSVSLDFGDGLTTRIALRSGTEENARLVGDTIKGWVAMGKMLIQQQQPELFTILDEGVQIEVDGVSVRMRARLSSADLELIRGLAEEQMASGTLGNEPGDPGDGRR